MNNLLSNCGLVDTRIKDSEKIFTCKTERNKMVLTEKMFGKVKYVEIDRMCYVELSPDIYVFLRRRYDFRQILTSQHSSANQSATLSRKSTEWLTEI